MEKEIIERIIKIGTKANSIQIILDNHSDAPEFFKEFITSVIDEYKDQKLFLEKLLEKCREDYEKKT